MFRAELIGRDQRLIISWRVDKSLSIRCDDETPGDIDNEAIRSLVDLQHKLLKNSEEFVECMRKACNDKDLSLVRNRLDETTAVKIIEVEDENDLRDVIRKLEEEIAALKRDRIENMDVSSTQVEILKEKIRSLENERMLLEQRHKNDVSVLTSNYEEELSKTRSILEDAKCDESQLECHLRRELESKYDCEMTNLRGYFQDRFAELLKQFAGNIGNRQNGYSDSSESGSGETHRQKSDHRKLDGSFEKAIETYDAELTNLHMEWERRKESEKLDLERRYALEVDCLRRKLNEMAEGAALEDRVRELHAAVKAECEEETRQIVNRHLERLEACEKRIEELLVANNGLQKRLEESETDFKEAMLEKMKQMLAEGSELPSEFSQMEKLFYEKFQREFADMVNGAGLASPLDMSKFGLNSEDDVSKLLEERDALRRVNSTLNSVVDHFTRYLSNCEKELNDSLIEGLTKEEESNSSRNVHFAPDVSDIVSMLGDEEADDNLSAFRTELNICLERLRKEAAAVLTLTSSRKTPKNSVHCQTDDDKTFYIEEKMLRGRLREAEAEIEFLTNQVSWLNGKIISLESVECYGEGSLDSGGAFQTQAIKRLNGFLDECVETEEEFPCMKCDIIIEEARREREDLTCQMNVANKRLAEKDKILKLQGEEWDRERREFDDCKKCLEERLWKMERELKVTRSFDEEIRHLEEQVKVFAEEQEDSDRKKRGMEEALKAATVKIGKLRERLEDLERELADKWKEADELKERLMVKEKEVGELTKERESLKQDLEALRTGDIAHLQSLEDQHDAISMMLKQMKNLLADVENDVMKRARMLENNLPPAEDGATTASTPSEDVSVADRLAATSFNFERLSSPTNNGPDDLLHCLREKLGKLYRAEEATMRRVKDQNMQLQKLSRDVEELEIERDTLQETLDEKVRQLTAARVRLESLKDVDASSELRTTLMEKTAALEEAKRRLKDLHAKGREREEEFGRNLRELREVNQRLARDLALGRDILKKAMPEAYDETRSLASLFETFAEEKDLEWKRKLSSTKKSKTVSFSDCSRCAAASENQTVDLVGVSSIAADSGMMGLPRRGEAGDRKKLFGLTSGSGKEISLMTDSTDLGEKLSTTLAALEETKARLAESELANEEAWKEIKILRDEVASKTTSLEADLAKAEEIGRELADRTCADREEIRNLNEKLRMEVEGGRRLREKMTEEEKQKGEFLSRVFREQAAGEARCEEYTKVVEQLKGDLKMLAEKNGQLTREMEQIKSEMDALKAGKGGDGILDAASISRELEDCECSGVEMDRNWAKFVQNYLKSQQDTIEELTLQLDADQKTINEMTESRNRMSVEHIRQQMVVGYFEDRCSALVSKLEEYRLKNVNLELELCREKSRYQLLESSCKHRGSNVDSGSYADSLARKLVEMDEENRNMAGRVVNLESQKQSLEAELNAIKVIEQYHSDSESDLSRTLPPLKAKLSEIGEKYAHSKCELERKREELTILREQLKNEAEKCNNTKEDLETLRLEKGRLQEDVHACRLSLEEERARRERLQEKLEALEAADASARKARKAQTESLENDKREISELRDKLGKERANLRKKMTEVANEIAAVKEIKRTFNSYIQEIWGRAMRAESFRRSLTYQKHYLTHLKQDYEDKLREASALLSTDGRKYGGKKEFRPIFPSPPRSTPKLKFKAAVLCVIFTRRVHFLISRHNNRIGKTMETYSNDCKKENLIDAADGHAAAGIGKTMETYASDCKKKNLIDAADGKAAAGKRRDAYERLLLDEPPKSAGFCFEMIRSQPGEKFQELHLFFAKLQRKYDELNEFS